MKITRNFSSEEMRCSDGTHVPEMYWDNMLGLFVNLQRLRNYLGKAIHINSGYRTPAYNTSIGGATNSQHLVAKAADIQVVGFEPAEIAKVIEGKIKNGEMWQGGLGVYKTFVHYDIRGYKARWKA